MSARRVLLVAVLVAITAVFGRQARVESTTGSIAPSLPLALAGWRGTDVPLLPADGTNAAGADLVLNRLYTGSDGRQVGVYLAAYDRQRPGTSIHSPLHCLPGTGWNVLSDDLRDVDLRGDGTSAGSVRRLLAGRGPDRIVVWYWYGIHGRMVASDLLSRVYLLRDGLWTGRNDARLIRIVVPVNGEAVLDADRTSLAFLRAFARPLTGREGPVGDRAAS